jgi:hypothetical protein
MADRAPSSPHVSLTELQRRLPTLSRWRVFRWIRSGFVTPVGMKANREVYFDEAAAARIVERVWRYDAQQKALHKTPKGILK